MDAFGDAYVAGMTDSSNFPVKNAVQPALGVNGVPREPGPDLRHALDSGPGRVGGEGHAVEGPYRGAVDAVGHEAVLGEHLQHPDLHGAAYPASGEHQRGEFAGLGVVVCVDVCVVVVLVNPCQPLRPAGRSLLEDEPDDQHQQDHRHHDEHAEHHGERGDGSVGRHRFRGYR